MKALAKRWLACVPGMAPLAFALSNRLRLWRLLGGIISRVRQQLFPHGMPVCVMTGPFAGMRYLDQPVWGILTNKWLGSYECELDSVIEQISREPYERVLDVGCAEGWYLVGLARRMPGTSFIGFDIDPISRLQCCKLAALNHVECGIRVLNECVPMDLDSLAGAGTLLICDIEGGEAELLDPTRSPALRRTDVLVEVHEASGDSRELSRLLRGRFETTHEIAEILPRDRMEWARLQLAKFAGRLDLQTLQQAADELRAAGNHWLWMKSRPNRARA